MSAAAICPLCMWKSAFDLAFDVCSAYAWLLPVVHAVTVVKVVRED